MSPGDETPTQPPEGPSAAESRIRFAEALGRVDNLSFNAADVAEDLIALEQAFPEPSRYAAVLEQVLREIRLVKRQPGSGKPTWGRLSGWRRLAFQSLRRRGHPADLRIVFRSDGEKLELLGFGHRHWPEGFYRRLGSRPAQRSPESEA